MRNILFVAVVMGLGFAISGCETCHGKDARMHGDGSATGFINKEVKVGDVTRNYSLYVPRGYTTNKEWPLIVFLHGIGERGDDGLLQTEVGIGRAIRRHADRFPCLVAMPQCPDKVFWDKVEDHIDGILAQVRGEYRIDPARIYLTGLSLGGFATWIYGSKRTDTYAALMPICGGGNPEDAAALAKVPIWAFHGDADEAVPVRRSREMVQAVKEAGGNIKYTEYPGVGHNSWDSAYDDEEAINWLLEQRKK